MPSPSDLRVLRLVRIAHTVVWAVFAGSIVAIPFFALRRDLRTALILIGVVFVEVVILAVNGMRCPLTGIAARYTEDRRDNFDILLPEWLARYNKEVFGTLYVAGILLTLAVWLWWPR
jgi:hypothetical protein